MKTPHHTLHRIYPHGWMWHVWKHHKTGELRSQHRPFGAAPLSPGSQWNLVRSTPNNPKICRRKFADELFAGL